MLQAVLEFDFKGTDDSVLQIRRSSGESVEPEAWVNAFLGRIFWDFLGEKYWANVVSKKIQMKLSKIRVRTHFSWKNPVKKSI